MVQVVPDHDGQGVGPGGRLLHPLQGTVTATIVLTFWLSGDKCSPGRIVIDAVPADHGCAAVDLGAEESHHQRRREGRGHGDACSNKLRSRANTQTATPECLH